MHLYTVSMPTSVNRTNSSSGFWSWFFSWRVPRYPGLGVCRNAWAVERIKPWGTCTVPAVADPGGFWQFMVSEIRGLRLPNSHFRHKCLSLCLLYAPTKPDHRNLKLIFKCYTRYNWFHYPKTMYFCGGTFASLIKGIPLFIFKMIWITSSPKSTEERNF